MEDADFFLSLEEQLNAPPEPAPEYITGERAEALYGCIADAYEAPSPLYRHNGVHLLSMTGDLDQYRVRTVSRHARGGRRTTSRPSWCPRLD
jgi:hypothetical protein